MSQNVFWQDWVATTNVKVTVRAHTVIDSLILFSLPCLCTTYKCACHLCSLSPLLLCLRTTYKCVCHLSQPESRCWRSNWMSCGPWSRASWPPRPVWWPHWTTAPTNSTCRKLLTKPGCWYGSCRSKRKLCCAAWTGTGPSMRLCPSSNSLKSRVRMLWTLSTVWLVSGIDTSFTHFQMHRRLFDK